MIVLAPDFMTKICKKAAQDFHRAVSKVFDRVKSVALWSANIRKLAKDHKGYGSAAKFLRTMSKQGQITLDITENLTNPDANADTDADAEVTTIA